MIKYKAYLIESGYESDRIDEHFIKVAKLKRKHTLSNKGGGGGEGGRKGRQSGKLILSRHGTLCFYVIHLGRGRRVQKSFPQRII